MLSQPKSIASPSFVARDGRAVSDMPRHCATSQEKKWKLWQLGSIDERTKGKKRQPGERDRHGLWALCLPLSPAAGQQSSQTSARTAFLFAEQLCCSPLAAWQADAARRPALPQRTSNCPPQWRRPRRAVTGGRRVYVLGGVLHFQHTSPNPKSPSGGGSMWERNWDQLPGRHCHTYVCFLAKSPRPIPVPWPRFAPLPWFDPRLGPFAVACRGSLAKQILQSFCLFLFLTTSL